jgi:myo-inositol 2-dehydrogenase/D-chiro-inositol 1-dehydrogenase
VIRVALFGAGRIGTIHAASVGAYPGTELSYVVDVNSEAAESLSAKFGARAVSVEEALGDPEIDLTMICSSTDTHADLIEKSARAGKAIFSEKPIDLSLERVRACLEVVKESGAKLMVGFNRRFDPNFLSLKEQLASGAIGTPELVTIASRDPGAPPPEYLKVSGGLFRDMTIHDFDMARWLLEEEPAYVYASGAALVDPRIEEFNDLDTAVVTLTCESGKMAVITNSRRATYGYDQRIEVHGSGGMLSAGNVLEHTVVRATEEGQVAGKPMHFFLKRYAAAYHNEFASLITALRAGGEITPSGDDGEKALRLAEAAFESLKSGSRITLS